MAMIPDKCYCVVEFEWMLEGCTHQDWLWDHLFWSSNAHFTTWIWVTNIIDIVDAFLFTIWLDELKRTMEKNFELITRSLLLQSMRCMSGWLGSFMKADDNILEGYVSTGGKFMTDWPSWWVLAWCTQSMREQFSRESRRQNSSWWIKQHHT